MCTRRYVLVACVSLALAGACEAQQTPQFVEIWSAKIKQDRVAEFGTLASRIADANRKSKADNFIAFMDFYGPDGSVSIASIRNSADEIEPAAAKFMGAIREHLGYTPDRLMAEIAKLVDQSHSELRRRRPDLSWNVSDSDQWMTTLGQSRYLMTIRMNVKPGRNVDFEKQMAKLKQAGESGSAAKRMIGVSQVVAGLPGSVYYVALPMKSVADVATMPSLRQVLGDDGYAAYADTVSQNVQSFEYRIAKAVPEWSNPPKVMADADQKFWNVRPPAPKPKPAATEAPKAKAGL